MRARGRRPTPATSRASARPSTSVGVDPAGSYTVEVLFPSQAKLQFANVIPGELETSMYNLTYGSFTVPQALNATELSGTTNFVIGFVSPVKDSAMVDDSIVATIKRSTDDSATVDDSIVIQFPRSTDDSATIDDSISFKVFIRLTDGVRGESSTVADSLTGDTKPITKFEVPDSSVALSA